MTLPLKDKKFLWLLFSVILVIALEVLSLLNIHLPDLIAPFFFAALIIGIGHSVIIKGLKSLIRLRFSSINLLMLIAVIGAFYLGEYPEAAVVIVLFVLGERLEDIGIETSKSALDKLVKDSPKNAKLENSDELISVEKVVIGSIIEVKPHDLIPLDGIIVNGNTAVDEASITGEPLPKDKREGDTVFGGTLNKQGFIKIKTTKEFKNNALSKIIQLTFEAKANKSERQKFIEKFSRYYTPSVLVVSISLFIIPVFLLGLPLDKWLNQAISILVIACPCALVISTPIAIYSALGNASSKGVIIKGGKYIEDLASINAICLDKTRTITKGEPVISDVIPFNNTSIEELLACSAGAEMFSEHPLAEAIVEESKKRGFEPHKVENFESVIGKGAKAECLVCEHKDIFLGKLSYIKELHPVKDEAIKAVEKLDSQGKTSVVFSDGGSVSGVLGITDEIKEDSREAIQELISINVKPVMLTGDNQQTAEFVAKEVNIEEYYGNLLPEDKSERVKELLIKYKSVAMVGDGVNDAPALALADVGIAMGAAGSDTAIEVADIALMNDKLSLIPNLIKLGRKTLYRIKQNTAIAIIVKFIFLVLAFLGHANLVFAIVADVGVTILVIALSLRLMSFKL